MRWNGEAPLRSLLQLWEGRKVVPPSRAKLGETAALPTQRNPRRPDALRLAASKRGGERGRGGWGEVKRGFSKSRSPKDKTGDYTSTSKQKEIKWDESGKRTRRGQSILKGAPKGGSRCGVARTKGAAPPRRLGPMQKPWPCEEFRAVALHSAN